MRRPVYIDEVVLKCSEHERPHFGCATCLRASESTPEFLADAVSASCSRLNEIKERAQRNQARFGEMEEQQRLLEALDALRRSHRWPSVNDILDDRSVDS